MNTVNLRKFADYLITLTGNKSIGSVFFLTAQAGLPLIDPNETLTNYIRKVFGIIARSSKYKWLFSMEWQKVDPTVVGVAKRIYQLIEDDELPANWRKQMDGEAPLSYMKPTQEGINYWIRKLEVALSDSKSRNNTYVSLYNGTLEDLIKLLKDLS
jgi:hypothetical protein